ncbi:MAG: FtsX-like permease family protein [Dysgonamonadaceae bacterium]|jgi:putative ABC transport system permease protein|nr:FtsX-like permease family protein [Dysgonamonadaceae bacterium]
MNLIVRNLLHVLRRFKLAAILNILGLSVAFAAFMIIMMQLRYDFGFDKFHKDYDKIFRMELGWQKGGSYQTVISRPLAEGFFASSPHIVAGALSDSRDGRGFFRIDGADEHSQFEENRIRVTPEFTNVFTFDFVEGDKDVLKIPDNIMIPLSLSRKLFGNESAIGKRLVLINNENQLLQVGAVYRDFPANSTVSNHVYMTIPESENKESWGNSNYYAFIRVNDASNAPMLFENFKRSTIFPPSAAVISNGEVNIRLTALPDIHFTTDTLYDNTPKASRQTLMILFAIGIAIISIAAINFTNFSTALTPMRIKNINTQRVLGAQQNTIRLVLVFEAIVFSIISYFVAVLLVKLFGGSELANLIDADFSFPANSLLIGGTFLAAIVVGIFAGMYPAYYMTSFAPALVLKGSFGLSPKGKQLRNTLISIQFVAALALIIGASFMYLQNRFMQNSDLGYDQNALITTNIWKIQGQRDALTHQLNTHSGIEGVTFGEVLLSSSDQYMGWGRNYNGENINFQVLPVHYTFLNVMGIEIIDGRDFRQEDAGMEQGVLIFNETARQRYELELNTTVEDAGEVIGFMPDVKFASFRQAVEPMAFFVWGTQNWGNQPNQAYIRLKQGANVREVMKHIRTTLAEFDPNFPFEVRFFDEVLQRLYEKETQLSLLITLFSLIAIFISIVGVFGLVVFDSECRRKEIGIRKILGASTIEIITMFNKTYVKMLLICFVIAAPLAWYAVSRWLENFAYRTPMYWWVYLLALIAVAAITILTVTIQNWRVANDDPVKSIKTE